VPQDGQRGDGQGGSGEGPGGRQQRLALSPEQELEVGRRAYREVMSDRDFRERVLPPDNPQVRQGRNSLARIVKASEIEPLQREINLRIQGYRFEWEANVVRDKQVNAFSLPAGKIFVYTGILRITGDNADFLATVLSHEAAHVLAHHASERVAREQSREGIFRSLSYDRMQESEADHIGVFLMTFAGYDPDQAVVFWQKMLQAKGGDEGPPEILSDHPSDRSRIRELKK